MKVIVLEHPRDNQSEVYFIDLDLIDKLNADQVAYRRAIHLALKDEMGITEIHRDHCFFYSYGSFDNMKIDLPSNFDELVTLYVEY